ncbi:MAG: 2-oxo acid dehydrogenase subunit E2 [Bacteroides sp.]|nr:MAG: 2-oxo acid dehydrogenase subunit E2 [Bacteroides sp.]
MSEIIKMPKMSDTMISGTLVKWHKKIGDNIVPGDMIAEIETDKAIMDLESYHKGILLYIGVKENENVPVDSIIAILGDKNEDISSIINQNDVKKCNNTLSDSKKDQIKASPLAKKMAIDKNISLRDVISKNERITKNDIINHELKHSYQEKNVNYYDVPTSSIRNIIALKLSKSKFTAPHFYIKIAVRTDKLNKLKNEIFNDFNIKISFNNFIIKAVSNAIKLHPNINTSWNDSYIRYFKNINIGVAVSTNENLYTPVIKNTENKSLSDISNIMKDLIYKAQNNKFNKEDLENSTFTISNLGMYGVEEFTAIINPPNACILSIGSIQKIPHVIDDKIKICSQLKMILSCDHRLVDGKIGAEFLSTLKNIIENPFKILI